jgi:uncharacterized repeat protein (TIGR03803 family)
LIYRCLVVATLGALSLPGIASAQTLEPYEVMHALAGNDGANAQSGLIRGADDRLYGIANTGGGPDGAGAIFSIAPGGPLVIIHTFLTTEPESGLNPVSLMRGRDKNLYGTSDYGGSAGDGVIYKLSWDQTTQTYAGVTVLHSFDCANGEGGDPWGTLIEGPDGALYGTTVPSSWPDPACNLVSTVFKLNRDGSGFQVLGRFDYLTVGNPQFGPLAVGADGSIFGTLTDSLNPTFQYGSIYRISPEGDVSFLKVFGNSPDGAHPFSGVVRGPDDALYGTTYSGGESGVGTIFRITEEGDFSTLYSFEADSVHTPYSPLVVGGDGVIYGMAHDGGVGFGGSYIFDPVSGFSVHQLLVEASTGSGPWGPLGVGADRHLYGTQSSGGAGGQGTLFGLGDIEVANRPPFAVAQAFPNPSEALTVDGATVTINALGSWDPDFDNLTYSWVLPPQAIDVNEAADHSTVEATFPEGTWPVTLNVSDQPDGSNPRSVTIHIVVMDAPPHFSAVVAISVPATGPTGANVTYTVPTATDLIDGVRPVECLPASGSLFAQGTHTVICRASDLTGHEATTQFTVTVTAAVLINAPGDLTVEATDPAGAAVPFVVSATSALGAPLPVTCSTPSGLVVSGATFAIGQTPVTCSARDPDTGLDAFASFVVTVQDTTGPVITMDINGIEFNAQGPFGAVIDYSSTLQYGMVAEDVPSAYDAVDLVVPVLCNPPPGSTFPLGDENRTLVLCTAEDSRGNLTEFRFEVIVRDGDYPVLTVPGPIVAEATGPAGAQVTFTPTATDITSPGEIVITCDHTSGTTFSLGTTTVTCQATDVNGHTSPDGSFSVTVRDTTSPAITMPANMTLEATGPGGAVAVFVPSVVEAVSLASPVCTPAAGSTFPLGTTVVGCVAVDGSGNAGSGVLQVTVVDTTGPVITVPANMTVVAAGPGGTAVSFAVSAVDAVDGARTVGCSPASGATFPVGTTVVNCRSLDTRGNVGRASFTVTVVNTPPTLVVTLSPGVLWPPNHKMVTINATIVATTGAGPAPIVTLVSITSSEADNGLGDGDTANDIQGATYGTNDRVFQLRAERSGKGNGRVYTVTYKATHALSPGIFTLASATVTVPHDMSGKTK